jgi:hypothetical protein
MGHGQFVKGRAMGDLKLGKSPRILLYQREIFRILDDKYYLQSLN